MTDYEAAIQSARERICDCRKCIEAIDDLIPLTKAVGAFELVDAMYIGQRSMYEARERAKASADRLAAPYLEEVPK